MPQTDDAIAALRQAAEEAGLEFVAKPADTSPYPELMLLFTAELDHELWFYFGEDDIPAAHALIAFWKRRGWVPCPECEGDGFIEEWVADDYGPFKIVCHHCKGEKRVPLKEKI